MPQETILFVSVGRTDLQVLGARIDGELARLSIGRDLRHFHAALLNGALAWELDPEAVSYPEASPNDKLDWAQELKYPGGYREHRSEPGQLVLVPAKLAPAIEALGGIPDLRVTAAVLFTTDRDNTTPPGIYHNEPVAAAPILAGWLAQRFGLGVGTAAGDIGPNRAGWINILDGGLLSPGAGRDSPINREALRRVEQAMRQALQWSDPQAWACLSLMGGLPELKEPIKACAEYHFAGRAFTWQAPQYTPKDFRWVPPDEEPPVAADSYRVRRHVESLLRRGAFLEAYGAASELEADAEELRWVEKVRQVAAYVSGEIAGGETSRDALIKPLRALVWPLGEGHPVPRSLLAGVRAEAALWAGRTSEAVIASVTFFEAAVLDAVEMALPDGCRLDDVRERIDGDTQALRDLADRVNAGVSPTHRLPLAEERGAHHYTIGSANFRSWRRILKPAAREALSNYRNALDIQDATSNRVIDRRHQAVHSVLGPDEIGKIHTHFVSAGIWAAAPQVPGEAFLKQELASRALAALAIGDAPRRYRALVDGLISDMRGHQIA